ncbi:MAG: CAF17-like 4Fe-4S cluster assembly/insertion protein YgfZ [Caulobacterales bacterium]|uniref:CAF17-like 4Fe-4S cluster assembly/insertion protein YgfZ n=1 Tax=Glycocaulis sp. TaxID=1969725 RepID=UPI003F9ECAE9
MTDTAHLTRLSHRAVIHISGEDAQDFLQRVVTNGPQGVSEGVAVASALLTPQGKVLSDLVFFADGAGGLFVDVPAGEAEALLKRFTLYRLRARAALALRPDLVVAAASDSHVSALKSVALASAPDPRNSGLGLRAIIPAEEDIPDAVAAYQAARLSMLVTEMPFDYGPAEVFSTDVNHDLLNMINYKKGCFVGQEVASRMHRKGGVRKRTIALEASEGLVAGQDVISGETPLGTVLTAQGKAALALVRIDRLEAAGSPVMAGAQAVGFRLPPTV